MTADGKAKAAPVIDLTPSAWAWADALGSVASMDVHDCIAWLEANTAYPAASWRVFTVPNLRRAVLALMAFGMPARPQGSVIQEYAK